MKGDNKIAIPWYRRNVRFSGGSDMSSNPISFDPLNIPKPSPVRQPQPSPVRQPSRVPAPSPANQPVRVPSFQPNPVPLPTPIPIPERNPNRNPAPEREPAPAFPMIPNSPAWTSDPNYDWGRHLQRVSAGLPQPEPEQSPITEAFETLINPVVTFLILNEAKNEYIRVNVTDPIYGEMLKDPVLGMALREAEKSNLDMEAVGTYFANYDWENVNTVQMTKDLTAIVGAAGATRIIIFIIGKKVAFRL